MHSDAREPKRFHWDGRNGARAVEPRAVGFDQATKRRVMARLVACNIGGEGVERRLIRRAGKLPYAFVQSI